MSITSVVVQGSQLCNFVWLKSGQLSAADIETYLDIHFSDINVAPDPATLLFAKFNGTLNGGTYASTGEEIVGWNIYKQKKGESILHFVGYVDKLETQIVDHNVKNGAEYTYYLFPEGLSTMGSPIISKETISKVWNWVIFTASPSGSADNEDVLTVNNAYVFQGNISTDSISNNSDSTVLKNFTQYPKVIKGTSNYKSGKLTALIGAIDFATNRYVEAEGLRDALFALTTSQDRMFLKNRAGDIWEISIHQPVSMSVSDVSYYQPNTATIEWTEIAAMGDISLVSEEDIIV